MSKNIVNWTGNMKELPVHFGVDVSKEGKFYWNELSFSNGQYIRQHGEEHIGPVSGSIKCVTGVKTVMVNGAPVQRTVVTGLSHGRPDLILREFADENGVARWMLCPRAESHAFVL